MNFLFTPNGKRAELLNLRMCTDLASSLEYLSQELQPSFSFDQEALSAIIYNLRIGKCYSALTFALYTQLVYSVTQQEDENTEFILNILCQQKILESNHPDFLSLNSSYFNGQEHLFVELMNVDESADFQIVAPELQSANAFKARLAQSMNLIDDLLPDLGAEINALVSQVIMVEPSADSGYTFDGGSSYMLWGGLFLNVHSHESVIAIVEVLAHESAHMLLFGFASEEPLTLNPSEARYNSPLREDKRPMEGIYHAMYVSARMFWAMDTLLQSDTLSEDFRTYVEQAVLRDLEAFSDGYNVVKQYGELTDTGQKLLDECFIYMQPHLTKMI